MNKTVFEHLENYHNTDKLVGEVLESYRNSKFSTVKRGAVSRSQWYKFDANTRDLIKGPNNLYHIDFNFEFIPRANRLDFRESKWYNTMISHNDIYKNYNLFELVPVLFIDGHMYTNFFIEAHEDITSLLFKTYTGFSRDEPVDRLRDGFSTTEIKNLINSELAMTIYFIPSFSIYTRRGMNRLTMVNYMNSGFPLLFNPPFEALNTRNNPFEISRGGSMALMFSTIEDRRMYKYKPFFISEKLIYGDNIPLDILRPDRLTNTVPWIRICELRNISIFTFYKKIQSVQYPNIKFEPYEVLNTDSMMVLKVTTINGEIDNVEYVHNPDITIHYPQLIECNEMMTDNIIYVTIVPVTLFDGDSYDGYYPL